MLRNTKNNYGWLAKTFHWILALLILTLLGVGLYMTSLPEEDPNRLFFYWLHKSTGVLVLTLVVLRLSWRWVNRVPELPFNMPRWQKIAARGNHYALYGLMIIMPLSGFMMSSFGGHPIDVYGLFTFHPMAQGPNKVAWLSHETHINLVYFWFALIGLHVSAAMYHHFWRKDTILRRMLPWTR